jgi:hypothetical protein
VGKADMDDVKAATTTKAMAEKRIVCDDVI